MSPGWGDAVGFVFNLFGSKEERRRNKLAKLRKERDELQKKPQTDRNSKRMSKLLHDIGVLEKQAINK